jgi:hypothetical protein
MTKVGLYAIGTSTTLESNKRLSRWGVKDGQKCPFKDSHVAAITLITPCRGSGDHASLTLFAQTLLPIGIPSLACGLGSNTLCRKMPHVRLVPLNVGYDIPVGRWVTLNDPDGNIVGLEDRSKGGLPVEG